MREPHDFVICRECGKLLRLISSTHLKLHGMTRDDYRKKHPKASLVSGDFRDKHRRCDSSKMRDKVMWGILWLFGTEPEDYVTCRECGGRFQYIQWAHLRKHNMTIREYREKHSGARIMSFRYIERRRATLREGYASGRLKIWCKDLTKETDERVAYAGRRVSEVKQERKRQGVVYLSWNTGYTKETHPSLALVSEKNKHQIPWNKGKTKETEPRLVLAAEIRSKTMLDGFRSGRNKIWSKGLTKETDPRLAEASLSHIEERERRWKRYRELGIRIGAERPNGEEKILGDYLSVFGYVYNRKVLCSGFSSIMGRERRLIPDFVSEQFPDRPVEYLGWLGHSPESPYNKGWDVVASDNERDQVFSQNGYTNINIYPEDLKKGRGYIVSMMEEKLCQPINM